MDMKEKLIKLIRLRNALLQFEERDTNYNSEEKLIDLDKKIDRFIEWYSENIVKDAYINEKSMVKKLENFIEKMAVWYEFKYPDYIFECPDYKVEQINEDYNIRSFINLLSDEEKKFLARPRYVNEIDLEIKNMSLSLNLSSKGRIMSYYYCAHTKNPLNGIKLVGMLVEDAISVLKENDMYLVNDISNNKLELAIQKYKNEVYQKEELLNCVMYKIIERGGNIVGPRRAFLFAKEFGRDIDIPMKYGVDYSDFYLKDFINEYIKAGGSKDLVCYVSYFLQKDNCEKINTVTIQELIKKLECTLEEKELYQRLINALAIKSDLNTEKKDNAKQLKKQKKLKNQTDFNR